MRQPRWPMGHTCERPCQSALHGNEQLHPGNTGRNRLTAARPRPVTAVSAADGAAHVHRNVMDATAMMTWKKVTRWVAT
jgi:hypothetical protein